MFIFVLSVIIVSWCFSFSFAHLVQLIRSLSSQWLWAEKSFILSVEMSAINEENLNMLINERQFGGGSWDKMNISYLIDLAAVSGKHDCFQPLCSKIIWKTHFGKSLEAS